MTSLVRWRVYRDPFGYWQARAVSGIWRLSYECRTWKEAIRHAELNPRGHQA